MPAGKWQVDRAHSSVEFRVRHMVLSRVRGTFGEWDADLWFDPDEPASSRVEVEIETASVDTRESERDRHLRSSDFFDVERYPTMSFRSTEVRDRGRGRLQVIGNLTIRDVTKPVRLDSRYAGRVKDSQGAERIGFEARGRLNRKDFGLEWNAFIESGGLLVGEVVEIEVDLEAVKSQG